MRLPFVIVLAAILLVPIAGRAQPASPAQGKTPLSYEESKRAFAIGAGAVVGGVAAFYATGFVLGGVAGYYALGFPGATLLGAVIGGVAGDWWYHGHLRMGLEDLKN